MKAPLNQKKKIQITTAASFILHAISIIAIIFLTTKVSSLDYSLKTLTQKGTELNKQMLQFNARTNNLKGCWQNNDYECPENKYFNSSRFVED